MEQLIYFDNRGNLFTKAGKSVTKGDWWVKLCFALMLVGVALFVVGPTALGLQAMWWAWVAAAVIGVGVGLCYGCRQQFVKGFLFAAIITAFLGIIYSWGIEYIMKFDTLGTVEFKQEIDWETGNKVVNDYDHSFKILLYGAITMSSFIFVFLLALNALATSYRLTLVEQCGKRVNNFIEDMKSLVDQKFHLCSGLYCHADAGSDFGRLYQL